MDHDTNTKVVSATNCSSETLLLTEEEATSFDGKIFSCSCGGGEDGWTDFLCAQQPDTWIQFAVTGRGTAEDHALIAVKGMSRLLDHSANVGVNHEPPERFPAPGVCVYCMVK